LYVLAKGFVLCAAPTPCVHRCDYSNGKPVSTNWSSSGHTKTWPWYVQHTKPLLLPYCMLLWNQRTKI